MGLISRRLVLGGLLAGVAGPAFAEAPARSPRPVPRPVPHAELEGVAALIAAAKLGGVTGFAVAELSSGRILEAQDADVLVPPASVAKIITALYALEKLGAEYRFSTRVLAVGTVAGGRLTGDLVLAGGGDPSLDTDRLGDLVAALAATGLREVTGRFVAHAGALPAVARIAADQPDHVGYNPGLSGLNLNFNRVYFEWKRAAGGWAIGMDARGERFVPQVHMARMTIARRDAPLFTQSLGAGVEDWSVASTALNDEGGRWLPVRQTAAYVAEVFQTLCAAQGIKLPKAEVVQAMPSGAVLLVEDRSALLREVLRDMLKFSTNVTAEVVGLTASGARGLTESAAAMTLWAAGRLGMSSSFGDHSGLGPGSRVTARDMLRALLAGQKTPGGAGLRGILRDVGMRDDAGKVIEGHRVKVRAKSGTLNFVSGLAGFVEPPSGGDLAFAIFSADVPRRSDLPLSEREQPKGGTAWTRRARVLQGQLIQRWAELYG